MFGYDTGFHEVADRVWVARYEWHDLSVSLIGGEAGLVLVDTHASNVAAERIMADAQRAGLGPVIAIVNTHEHYDHTFGNTAVRETFPGAPIYATRHASDATLSAAAAYKSTVRSQLARGECLDPRVAESLATTITPADALVNDEFLLDVGGRKVSLLFLGRGHTAGDLVVSVPDANVVHAGDLVEQTGPPVFLPGCFPLDWAVTLGKLLELIDGDSVVVPGHGEPVDDAWVTQQRDEILLVENTIRTLVVDGVPLDLAAARGHWPWPVGGWRFSGAIEAGYAQLRAEVDLDEVEPWKSSSRTS